MWEFVEGILGWVAFFAFTWLCVLIGRHAGLGWLVAAYVALYAFLMWGSAKFDKHPKWGGHLAAAWGVGMPLAGLAFFVGMIAATAKH